jgi:hypothetical protein
MMNEILYMIGTLQAAVGIVSASGRCWPERNNSKVYRGPDTKDKRKRPMLLTQKSQHWSLYVLIYDIINQK